MNLKRGAPSGADGKGKCPFGYKLVWGENFRYDDVQVGFSATFDDVKEGRKWPYIAKADALIAYTGAHGQFFFRSACLQRIVSAGNWF